MVPFYLCDLRALLECVAVELSALQKSPMSTKSQTKTSENVGCESCQTKYSDILDLFVVQYLSPEEIISTIALRVLLASKYTCIS